MESFEVHITGSESINSALDKLSIKNITIDLLKPNKEVLRTEYMSSFITKHENFEACKDYVFILVKILEDYNCDIIRVKIESPYYAHYKDICVYVESHFKPKDMVTHPVSRNARSGKLMATSREYNINKYEEFYQNWKHEDIEMCLYDTFINEDADWFEEYLVESN